MHLEAITFDIDDTLWDNIPVMENLEEKFHLWLENRIGKPLNVSIEESRQRRFNFALSLRNTEKRGDVTYVRRQIIHEIVKEHGIQEPEATALTQEAVEHMLELRHQVTPFPEVDGILESLSKHYALAVITNGNVDVTTLPLGNHFDVCFKAGEIGMPKPEPEVFEHTLQVLGGIKPENAMHVGDSWIHDVEPAQALGMQVAWIDNFNEPKSLPPNVHRLSHIRELPALLKRLGQPA